ncbi:MAG: hypothetical protein ACYS8W_16290 [Planctomycetota bacterium]|jgi:hypothetical protein
MRQKTFFKVALLAALLLAATLPGTLRADTKSEGVPLEKLVPKNTLIYVTVPSISDLREALKKSAFYGLWYNENIRKALPIVFGKLDEGIQMVDGQIKGAGFEFAINDLMNMFGGQVSLALTQIGGEESPIPMVVFQADITGEEEKVMAAVKTGLDMLKGQLGEALNITDRNGKPMITFAPPDLPFKIFCGFTAGSLIITNDEKNFKPLLDAADAGGAGESLATNETYKLVKSKVLPGGTPLSLVYYDADAFMKLLGEFMSKGMLGAGIPTGFLDMLKKLTGKAVGWGSALVGDTFVDNTFSYAPGGIQFPGLSKEPLTFKTAAFTPSNPLLYCAFMWNPKGIVDWLVEFASKIEPAAPDKFKEFREMVKGQVGFDIVDDLLTAVAGEAAIFAAPPAAEGGIIPGGAICIEIKDKAKWNSAIGQTIEFLEKFTAEQGGQLEEFLETTELAGGAVIYTFPILSSQIPDGVPIDITCGMIGDFFVIATTPQLFKEMMAKTPEKALAGSAVFTDAKKQFLTGANGVGLIDMQAIVRIAYTYGLTGLRSVASDMDGVKVAAMPQPDEVGAYFKPLCISSLYTEDGGYSRMSSNMGPASVLFLTVPIGAAAGFMVGSNSAMGMAEPPAAAGDAAVIANLRSLASVQDMHRVQFGKFATLKELGDTGYIDARLASGQLYGYTFLVRLVGGDKWECVAIPSTPGPGKKSYFIDETGIIRFTDDGTMPNRQSPVLK